jgi:hypothetical protein
MPRAGLNTSDVVASANGFQWSNDPDESVAWMIDLDTLLAGLDLG